MKLSYKQKLFIYFFIVFAAFTVIIIFFQQSREKSYKTETLRTTLDDYSDIIARYIQQHHLIDHQHIAFEPAINHYQSRWQGVV